MLISKKGKRISYLGLQDPSLTVILNAYTVTNTMFELAMHYSN